MTFVSRARRWLLLIVEYLGAQVAVRAISAASALLLINILPIQEYGIYTLFLASLTFLTGFSDFGATGSLLYFWRRANNRISIFAAYLQAVFRFRKLLFIGGALLSLIYIYGIARSKNYDEIEIAVGTGLMVIASWYMITTGTWLFAFRIIGRFRQSYVVEGAGEFAKLIIILLLWVINVRYSWAAMGSVLIGAFASASLAGYFSKRPNIIHKAHGVRMSHFADRAVWAQTVATMPWAIFFAVQGPLVVWLAATFGSVQNLAEVGALGRLGAIIGLISGFTISVFVPKLSNIQNDVKYFGYYITWLGVLFFIGSTLLIILWYWPKILLVLLGNQYKGLHVELFVAAVTAVVMTFEYFAGAINRARGWVAGQIVRISIIVLGQVISVAFLDFEFTADLLYFGLVTAILAMIVQLGFNFSGFLKIYLDFKNSKLSQKNSAKKRETE